MKPYHGLEAHFHARTSIPVVHPTKQAELIEVVQDKQLPFSPYTFLSFTKKDSVSAEVVIVFPFSAEQCFSVLEDYADFLDVVNTAEFRRIKAAWAVKHKYKNFDTISEPFWVNEGFDAEHLKKRAEVGDTVEHIFELCNVVYSAQETITSIKREFGNSRGSLYEMKTRFRTETVEPKNSFFDKYRNVFSVSSYQNSKNKSLFSWRKQFPYPKRFGVKSSSYAEFFKNVLDLKMQRQIETLRQVLNLRFSPKLPKCRSKVLVIGGGPSGLHMTHLLLQRGLDASNVTILEKSDRIGGKSLSKKNMTNKFLKNPVFSKRSNKCCGSGAEEGALISYDVDGEEMNHDLGTCYLSPSYFAVRALLKELQDMTFLAENRDKEKYFPDITREVTPIGYSLESKDWTQERSLEEFLYQEGKDSTCIDDFCCYTPATRRVGFEAGLLLAKVKYCKLHQQLCGNYFYTLPAQPQPREMKILMTNFQEFLEKNEIEVLIPLFKYIMSVQGYGMLHETPTFLAMEWLTPDFLDGILEWGLFFQSGDGASIYKEAMENLGSELSKFNNASKTMLVSSYERMWTRLVEVNFLENRIKYNSKIASIKRGEGVIEVKYSSNGSAFGTEYFDFLIVAAPLNDAFVDPTLLNKDLPLDIREKEREIFLNEDVTGCRFRTSVFLPEQNGKFAENHLRAFTDFLKPGGAGKGDIFALRDTYKALQPKLCTDIGDRTDPFGGAEPGREMMIYQYTSPPVYSNGHEHSQEQLEKKAKDFFKSQPGFENSKVLFAKEWTYYTHFIGDALEKGKLWEILDIQGDNNTFFVHASTNFESILDIVNYNNMVLSGLSGQLEGTEKPATDHRPDPWQRPQFFIGKVFTNAYFFWLKWILNFGFWFFWGLWYILTYPVAEGIYLRHERKNYREAFRVRSSRKSKLCGCCSFLKYSKKYFAKTSLFAAGLKGQTDEIFEYLQSANSSFRKDFPGVPAYPEVQSSIQWNLTDFRKAIRHLFSSPKTKKVMNLHYFPWLGLHDRAFLAFLNYYLPNYYIRFYSYAFARQFRFMVGYAYRFEDARGGGLKISSCSSLKAWTREYGSLGARKLCLTECKVLNEEMLRQESVTVEFIPDFLNKEILNKGEGFGCEIRFNPFREHAFSTHKVDEFVGSANNRVKSTFLTPPELNSSV
eukprot:maker-scaffold_20-snap-gene-4.45-mRNA-1 protein AED:0.14 eAED:0.16 QI:82/0.5/0.33/1/1/0.66/3/0/1162